MILQLEDLLFRLDTLGPLSMGYFPTPLEPLPRLSAGLRGPELWVKRDDQTGLAMGGNKVRKLNYLLADALRQWADVVITGGAPQSNHVRQTAAAAARAGVRAVVVLRGEPPADPFQGNLLLDRLLGAELVWTGARPLAEVLESAAETQRAAGYHPYVIPYGGSNPLGVCGYVAAMAELLQQARAQALIWDGMVVASSSGGTQAGLVVGARALGYGGRIVGISIAEPAAEYRAQLAALANGAGALLHLEEHFAPEDFDVRDAYLGEGYGVLGAPEAEAITLVARTEGLLLDPVYTGRAMAGLLDLVRRKEFQAGERVLFWHTGGAPALFAYGGAFK